CAHHGDAVGATLATLDALGRRDYADAEGKAAALLAEHAAALSPGARDWMLRLAMLAATGAGRYAHVLELDTTRGRSIAASPATAIDRIYMLAYADAQAQGRGQASSGVH